MQVLEPGSYTITPNPGKVGIVRHTEKRENGKYGATLEDRTSQTYDEDRIMNKADIVKWGVNMIAGFADAGVSVAGEI